MTRALPLPARQVTALCKGAARAGYIAEVKIGDVVIRLVPDDRTQEHGRIDLTPDPETFETLDDYLAWRDRNRAREDQGHS